MGDWTGTVPSHAAGASSKASKLQTLDDVETALTAAWTTWVPVLTNLTLGNGTQVAKYRRLNKTVDFLWSFLLGSTSAVATTPSFTLPYAPSTDWALTGNTTFPMMVTLIDAGNSEGIGEVRISSTTVGLFQRTSFTAIANITSTSPWTWGTGDLLAVNGTYYTA